ncbi:protein BatD [bacterium]|nr:protein BatD [bacterium]
MKKINKTDIKKGKHHFISLSLLATFLLIICAKPALADFDVSIRADKTNVVQGEQIQIIISVQGTKQASDPEFPESNAYEVYSRGRSSRFEIVNNQFSSSLDFNYVLIPLKKGRIAIPPIPISTGKETKYTETLIINVSEKASPPQGVEAEDGIFLTAEVDVKEPFVNQQIIYTLRLYRAIKIQGASLEPLEFEGFQAEKLGKEREFNQIIKGRQYSVTELRYALFPQKSGALTIPEARIQCQVLYARERRTRSPFDSFFDDPFFGGLGRYESKMELLSSKPIALNVRPLPAPAQPEFATPLVGDFKIEANLSQNQIKAGESATLTISISGRGNVQSIPDPGIGDIPAEFKVYEDKPALDIKTTLDGISGIKTYKKAIVPTKPGDYQMPAIKLPFLNPETGKYVVASTKPISITVLPGAEEENINLVEAERHTVTKEEIKLLGKDILPQKTSIAAVRDQSMKWNSPVLLLMLVIPPLTFFSAFAWEKKKLRLVTDKAYYRRKKALSVWKKNRKSIKSLKDEDRKRFYSMTSHGLKEFIGDRLNVAGRALTPAEIDQMLNNLKVPEELRRELNGHLKTLEMGEFGAIHKDKEERDALFTATESLINKLTRWI